MILHCHAVFKLRKPHKHWLKYALTVHYYILEKVNILNPNFEVGIDNIITYSFLR